MKIISYILFFFVIIITLMHDVVPHHHHESSICFQSSHCQNDTKPHNHENTDHKHDGNNDNQNCVLKQIVITDNHSRRESKFENGNTYIPLLFFALIVSNCTQFQIYTSLLPTSISILKSDYSAFIAESKGLRAPPII